MPSALDKTIQRRSALAGQNLGLASQQAQSPALDPNLTALLDYARSTAPRRRLGLSGFSIDAPQSQPFYNLDVLEANGPNRPEVARRQAMLDGPQASEPVYDPTGELFNQSAPDYAKVNVQPQAEPVTTPEPFNIQPADLPDQGFFDSLMSAYNSYAPAILQIPTRDQAQPSSGERRPIFLPDGSTTIPLQSQNVPAASSQPTPVPPSAPSIPSQPSAPVAPQPSPSRVPESLDLINQSIPGTTSPIPSGRDPSLGDRFDLMNEAVFGDPNTARNMVYEYTNEPRSFSTPANILPFIGIPNALRTGMEPRNVNMTYIDMLEALRNVGSQARKNSERVQNFIFPSE